MEDLKLARHEEDGSQILLDARQRWNVESLSSGRRIDARGKEKNGGIGAKLEREAATV